MCAQNILLRKDIDIWLCKKQPGVFKSSHHLAAPEVQVYVIFLEVDVRREVTFFCWNGRQSWVLYVKKHLNMAVGVWSLLESGPCSFVLDGQDLEGGSSLSFTTGKLLPSSILLCTWWPCLSDRTLLPLKTSTLFLASPVVGSSARVAPPALLHPRRLLIQDLSGLP